MGDIWLSSLCENKDSVSSQRVCMCMDATQSLLISRTQNFEFSVLDT